MGASLGCSGSLVSLVLASCCRSIMPALQLLLLPYRTSCCCDCYSDSHTFADHCWKQILVRWMDLRFHRSKPSSHPLLLPFLSTAWLLLQIRQAGEDAENESLAWFKEVVKRGRGGCSSDQGRQSCFERSLGRKIIQTGAQWFLPTLRKQEGNQSAIPGALLHPHNIIVSTRHQ